MEMRGGHVIKEETATRNTASGSVHAAGLTPQGAECNQRIQLFLVVADALS